MLERTEVAGHGNLNVTQKYNQSPMGFDCFLVEGVYGD